MSLSERSAPYSIRGQSARARQEREVGELLSAPKLFQNPDHSLVSGPDAAGVGRSVGRSRLSGGVGDLLGGRGL